MQTLKPTTSRSFSGNLALLFFATTWNGFIVFFINSLELTKTKFALFKVFFLLFTIPFVLVGIFLVFITIMAFIQDSAFFFIGKRPKLTIDLDIIKPGDEIKVTYFQTFKKDLVLENFDLELTAQEFIKEKGTITSRKEKEFKKIEENNIQCMQEQEIIKQYNIKIPSKEELGEFLDNLEIKFRYKTSASTITFIDSFKIKLET